jgi:hypothetical protein
MHLFSKLVKFANGKKCKGSSLLGPGTEEWSIKRCTDIFGVIEVPLEVGPSRPPFGCQYQILVM